MSDEIRDGLENTDNEDTGVEHQELKAPEQKNWWQFSSKEEAAEWSNKIVQDRLARERKKLDKELSEYATLKAEVEELRPLKQATQTDYERWEAEKNQLQAELNDLRSFRSQAERNDLVRQIADEKGLPARFISRVRGDDADTISADIEELMNVLEDGKPAKKPVQRKPVETDGDEPGKKGFGGGGSEGDDSFSVDNLLEKVRKNRGSSYAR